MIRIWTLRRPRRAGNLWLIIFSDLSTNLMLFFLMLFAMTRMSSAEKDLIVEGMQRATTTKKSFQQERIFKKRREDMAIRILQDTIMHGRLKDFANLEVDDFNIKLTMDLPLFFRTGSANLTEEAEEALGSLIIPFAEFPNDIVIEGHTDNVPIREGARYPSNWELSVARAVSVIDFFTKEGLKPHRLVAGGYGEYHPLYSNETKEGRGKNRRIEITIVRQPKI
jgi:chemotaxis protein MotB